MNTAGAAANETDAALEELRSLIELQRQQIEIQNKAIEAQQQRIDSLESALQMMQIKSSPQTPIAPLPTVYSAPSGSGGASSTQINYTPPTSNQAAQNQPVGEEDKDATRRKIDISGVQDVGGVLTPKGSFVFEPSIEYQQNNSNVFFFNGLEVIETVLVGDLQITEADRDTITAAAALRYGLTNRAEVEIKIPYVYRDDEIDRTFASTGDAGPSSNLDDNGLGDIQFAGRYQFNSGTGGWPIFIGNLRVKSDTGDGPFDIDYDDSGVEEELSTGSGFWAIEPGVTMVLPTDPAVLFATASYLWNIEEDVDETIGGAEIGDVDPGDVVGISFGIGLSLNETVSISTSYSHSFVMETETETNGETLDSDSFDVGTLNFGLNYRVTDDFSLNFQLQAGITDDAPDVMFGVRTPLSFTLF